MQTQRAASLLNLIPRGQTHRALRRAVSADEEDAASIQSVLALAVSGPARWLALAAASLALWVGFGASAQAQPANDAFSNAATLTGPSGSATGSTEEATKESLEPDHADNLGGRSIWFSWQAPINATMIFDTAGSSFDTVLGVYTGSSVANLMPVASNDDIGGGTLQSSAQFAAIAGTTYKIAVDGYRDPDGFVDSGSVVLSWVRSLDIVSTGPLTTITVGADGSFQVRHSSFANGQVYPPLTAPADAGFFVRTSDGIVTGQNIFNRPSAAESTFAEPFRPISQFLSQDGLQATMVMGSRDGAADTFQVTQVTRYRPGNEFFIVENTVLNQGAAQFTADYFAASDLYLADSDYGFGLAHSGSGAVGGTDSNRLYNIFIQGKPGNPTPVNFQEDFYDAIWEVIGTPGWHFDNTIRSDFIDNAAGLEWPNVTLAPGASVKIAYCWGFGALSDLAVSLTASPNMVNPGGQITYQAVVTNIGSATVTNVALTDVLPSGVSFVSASSPAGNCVHQNGTVTCALGVLASNQSALVTIILRSTAGGIVTNSVDVGGNQADVNLANNTAVAQVTALGDASPTLSIQAVGPNVVLRWQAVCASCVLQQADHLNLPISWVAVGAPVTTINGTNQVTLPRGTNNRFFQLGPAP